MYTRIWLLLKLQLLQKLYLPSYLQKRAVRQSYEINRKLLQVWLFQMIIYEWRETFICLFMVSPLTNMLWSFQHACIACWEEGRELKMMFRSKSCSCTFTTAAALLSTQKDIHGITWIIDELHLFLYTQRDVVQLVDFLKGFKAY